MSKAISTVIGISLQFSDTIHLQDKTVAHSRNVGELLLNLCYSLEAASHPHLEAQSPGSAEYKHPHVGHLNIWRKESNIFKLIISVSFNVEFVYVLRFKGKKVFLKKSKL